MIAGDFDADSVKDAVASIDVPFLSEEQEQFLADKILTIIFTSKSLGTVRRKWFARTARKALNADSRTELATWVNKNVDIPLVSEAAEQKGAEKLVNLVCNAMEAMIPGPLQDLLQNTDPKELREVRTNLIRRVNKAVNVPFVDEKQEQEVLTKIVDFWLDYMGLAEGTLTPE